jgi:hypothetical protein
MGYKGKYNKLSLEKGKNISTTVDGNFDLTELKAI